MWGRSRASFGRGAPLQWRRTQGGLDGRPASIILGDRRFARRLRSGQCATGVARPDQDRSLCESPGRNRPHATTFFCQPPQRRHPWPRPPSTRHRSTKSASTRRSPIRFRPAIRWPYRNPGPTRRGLPRRACRLRCPTPRLRRGVPARAHRRDAGRGLQGVLDAGERGRVTADDEDVLVPVLGRPRARGGPCYDKRHEDQPPAPHQTTSSSRSPGRPMTRLMKSRSGSFGNLNTTMSPR